MRMTGKHVAMLAAAVAAVGGTALAAPALTAERSADRPALESALTNLGAHHSLEAHGYSTTFYPGFVSRLAVETEEGRQVLYEQGSPYLLPAGQARPDARSLVRLDGLHGRELGLIIDDPAHQVARIIVEVYKDRDNGDRTIERIIIDEDAVTCPPSCDPDTLE